MFHKFKKLTFTLILVVASCTTFAGVANQQILKTHLRWSIDAQKSQIKVSKNDNKVTIETLDGELFNTFAADVAKFNADEKYYKNVKFTNPRTSGMPYKMALSLGSDAVELYSFFSQSKKEHILDFWINSDAVSTKGSSTKRAQLKVAKLKTVSKKKVKKRRESTSKRLSATKGKFSNILNSKKIKRNERQNKYRDFRYGAAFVWDYSALIPPISSDINLQSKAPDYLYKVKDRTLLEDKKEANMQLSINFYKKERWGLMTRSINLYDEKFGRDRNKSINNFMKAVSMIKNTLKPSINPAFFDGNIEDMTEEEIEALPKHSNRGIMAAARNLLALVVETTEDYELKKASLRYLIQYTRSEEDHIKTLEYAKKLYVEASESFDDEMIIYGSKLILSSLAHLKQLDKIKTFIQNKAVSRVLPKQEGLAYVSYINLYRGNDAKVTDDFKVNQKSLIKPIHPSILFNTAEAFFRQAKYKKAIKLFDQFISQYSEYNKSGEARLRVALSYDFLDRAPSKVVKLYEEAINKTGDVLTRYEAKIRYVGYRSVRKKKLSEEDIESIVFLDTDLTVQKTMGADLKKTLWLVRLRSLINTNRFDEALAYLSTLPLETLKPMERRTFLADGAEIVLGIIQSAYLKEDYSRAVKVWEVYKEKYESKVAKNPYMNFIVSDSFLRLGLVKSYERSVSYLEGLKNKTARMFPRWIEIKKNISVKEYLVELNLNKFIKEKNFKGLDKYLERVKGNKNINYNFYKGLVAFDQENYNASVASFEKILVQANLNNQLTPNQSNTMLKTYLESLFEVAPSKKFRKNAAALINDLRRNLKEQHQSLIERAEYLYIESLYGDRESNYKLIASKASEFIKSFKNSEYQTRMNYLRGIALINNKSVKEGKSILEKLMTQDGVPEYLKGLVRSELSSLVLQEKMI